MVKKGLCVWLFSSFTFIATLHLFDSISVLFFNGQMRLLQIYPLISQKLEMISPAAYFWASAAASLLFWGITCAIAFDNPVEHFLNILLSDAKKQGAVETQLAEEKSGVLDAMYETIESNNETLAHVKDMVYNIRTEVRQFQPIPESVEKIKAELNNLRRGFKRLDEVLKSPDSVEIIHKKLLEEALYRDVVLPAQVTQAEHKVCPYCKK